MPIDSTSVAPRWPVVSYRISNKSTKPLPGVRFRAMPSFMKARVLALGQSVMRAKRIELRRVTVGQTSGNMVEVLSGLTSEDRVRAACLLIG